MFTSKSPKTNGAFKHFLSIKLSMLITKIRTGLRSRSIFRGPVTFILSSRLFYNQDGLEVEMGGLAAD